MKKTIIIFIIQIFLISCTKSGTKSENNSQKNKISSPKTQKNSLKLKKIRQNSKKLKKANENLKKQREKEKQELLKTDIKTLVGMLKTKNRTKFIMLLEVLKDRINEALPVLTESLKSENTFERMNSANVLGQIAKKSPKAKNIAKALISAFEKEQKALVKSVIIEALGNLGVTSEPVKKILLKSISDNAGMVKWQTAVAIRKLKLNGPEYIKVLNTAIKDKEYWVSYESAKTLAVLDPDSQIPYDTFKKLLSVENQVFQRVFTRYLKNSGDKRVIPLLIASLKHKRATIRRLAAKGLANRKKTDAIVKALEEAQKDKDYSVRKFSADSLKTLK